MNPTDTTFTIAQASDLARYFLGPGWRATTHPNTGWCVLAGPAAIGKGLHTIERDTWRAAFRAAGIKLPYRRVITNVGPTVVDGDNSIATARSGEQARRIAVALNFYERHHPTE